MKLGITLNRGIQGFQENSIQTNASTQTPRLEILTGEICLGSKSAHEAGNLCEGTREPGNGVAGDLGAQFH